ncbi:MAG: alginate lyase family protein [Verrucomicrobia bacterium]|nr:alginate lyase family protein [Verrucomicrobiota bacterium]
MNHRLLMAALAAIICPHLSGQSTVCRPAARLLAPANLERARQRVRTEAWAQAAFERLAEAARKLEAEPLPVFDTQWWETARRKRWQDIYPEVHRHAGAGVGGPLLKTPDAALAYAISGERRHADAVRRVLLHYADYPFVARHPDVGMTWAGWGMAGLRACDLIRDTLGSDDCRRLDAFFERALAAVRANDEDWIREGWGGRFNNHYAHHKLFIGTCGLVYGRPELVDHALQGVQGFCELIENAARDDGLWFESSLNYHFAGIAPAAEFAAALGNAGHPFDLWHHAFANGRRLRDFFVAPIATLFPDRTLPTLGDTYGARVSLRGHPAYFAAFDAFPETALGWLLQDAERPAAALTLTRLPEGSYPAPAMRTRLWPEHGYIALRSQEGTHYWRGDGYSAFLSFDLDGIHSHRDKFGLMVYGRGAHLAVDPETVASALHAFSARVQHELNRETVCHNTLMVDGRSHAPIGQKLAVVDFIDGSDCKLATVADFQSLVYPGVRLMRTVAVTPDYVLDVFQAASSTPHTYDYLFHGLDDQGAFAVKGAFTPVSLGLSPPWNWLRHARQAPVEGAWAATARQGNLTTRLLMAAEPGTRLITCQFPRTDTFAPPAFPMLAARRTASLTVFVSLLQAERGPLPEAAIDAKPGPYGRLRVAVRSGGTLREFTVPRLE